MAWLSLDPTTVKPRFALSGSVVDSPSHDANVVVGLTLTRRLTTGSEEHALRARGRRTTLTFGGRNGRWRTNGQLGRVAEADLRIRAVAPSTAADELLGCFGAFRKVRVRLTGTLVLRTGVAYLRTIRVTSLTGSVVYSREPVVCGRRPPTACEQASSLVAGGASAFNASARELVVQFSEQAAGAPAGVRWYHVARAAGDGVLAGAPPSVQATAPERAIVRGRVTFSGVDAEEAAGPCPTTTYRGTATGTFAVGFTGWGARTLRLNGTDAIYRTSANAP